LSCHFSSFDVVIDIRVVVPGRPNKGQIKKCKGAVAPVAWPVSPSPMQQTTFKWRIDGFSSLLDKDEGWIQSSVFGISGLNWYN
jgi:hypothetical protein